MSTPAKQISQAQIREMNDELGAVEPTPNGSVYVKPQDMEWTPSQFEGIQMKVLYQDAERGEMTVLLKWAPGTILPFHKHP